MNWRKNTPKRCLQENRLRWAIGIVWNLAAGPSTFRALQTPSGRKSVTISPSILNVRPKHLHEANLVERSLEGYVLTELGRELSLSLSPWMRTP